MPAPATVVALVERFHQHLTTYKQNTYNEEQLRVEFLNPLFKALGWDVDNEQGYAAAYKEVIHEDAVKVAGVTKAPDYAFRIGGVRKFFLEAKKPAVNIKEDIHPAYQLRRYAWSAKLPLSILSDFEEFAVYDCRIKPDKSDPASTARVLYLRYTDYLERWDEIASVFSKEAILKGSFDHFAESHKAQKGTAEVDTAFLEEIERWRELLARNLALRNPGLSARELNFAVQQTIDRIIFLRICEDRGLEPYGELMGLQNGTQLYARLVQKFLEADRRYNSGLFHFSAEKGQSTAPDTLTPGLTLDDKVLKDIFKHLYYPDSPYEFSVLPAGILGQVYERFLGKVARLTPGRQVKIEEKPEVRKAGGVVYTPEFIADYIVRQVLARLLDGRTVATAAKLRLLDMACGSGIFLITLYQHLLDWHLAQYAADNAEKWARGRSPRLYRTPLGEWRLTLDERKRILLDHIYGVDIDPQAVEVTKLSLLLKLLEGETGQTLAPQLALLPQRILPDLNQNIRCGNSLIGPEFYDGQMALLDAEEAYRLNVFDWHAAFPAVFAQGGFDGIVGNPPYVRIQAMKEWAPREVEYYKRRYRAASKGNYDLYVVFVEKALELLNAAGRLGFILPHKFFNAQYGAPLRQLIAAGQHLEEIVHFGDQQVFAGVTTYTCLLFLSKAAQQEFRFVQAHDLAAWRQKPDSQSEAQHILVSDISDWNFSALSGHSLFERLSILPTKLGDVCTHIFQGIVTSADPIYILEARREVGNNVVVYSKYLDQELELETAYLRPFIKGVTIERYVQPQPAHYLLFPYNANGLISWSEIETLAPKTASFLTQCKKPLAGRENGKMAHERWYAYVYPKNLFLFAGRKLIVQVISKNGRYTIDDLGIYFTGGGNGPYYGLLVHSDISIEYVAGILNSKLSDYYLHRISSPFRGGYWSYGKRFIEQLPIRTIDFSDCADVARHDQMVRLVEQMLALHRQRQAARTPHEQSVLAAQIAAADQQIDRLVYALYGLSEEEIRIVESG
ncbi:MAG TPA: N-6 DNA methylase [Chloroflexi bacterium]|nr:N-6 DNA methylase [Chloroflexota bacterium]